jgi:hypothetical protein
MKPKSYSYYDRKLISNKIEKIKKTGNHNHLVAVSKIIVTSINQNDFTIKNDGILIDFNKCDDIIIQKVDKYLDNILDIKHNNIIESDLDIKSNQDPLNDRFMDTKFSNYEKSLIKRYRNNSDEHNDDEYAPLNYQYNESETPSNPISNNQ